MSKKVLVVSGPDLQPFGTGSASKSAEVSLEDIRAGLRKRAAELDVQVDCFQFNGEGEMVDRLRKAGAYAGVIINAGSLAQSGYALRSAIGSLQLPCVEVTLSNVHAGEESRYESAIAPACVGVIGGFGKGSYLLALEALVNLTSA